MKTGKTDYYCSQKFWWLSVDIEKIQTLSCCSATPSKINTGWLTKNPGQLFNTPELKFERQQMLDGTPVSSCSATCWKPESVGHSSRRIEMNSDLVTHTNISSAPEVLNIIVGSHCNMTCVYCCKQYSSAWKQDMLNNGEYPVVNDDRYRISNSDKVLLKLSQKDIDKSEINNHLLREAIALTNTNTPPRVNITGGEPFLYLNLEKLISSFTNNVKIQIWTGLGVNTNRFASIVDKLTKHPNVSITISAENITDYYEFNRAGNSWKQFETNLTILQQRSIPYNFNATIGNLTLFGLPDFFKYAGDTEVTYGPCTDPDFLSINVLDQASKEQVLNTMHCLPEKIQELITSSIHLPASDLQKSNLKQYLTEFAKRRNLSLSIFPESFTQWIYD